MLNGTSAPSVADIAAVTNGGGMGGFGEGWWAIIILFALFGGWGRGGAFGGGSGCGCDGACATVGDVQRGFDTSAITSKLNGIEQGVSQLGYADLGQFNNLTNAVSTLGYQTQSAVTGAQTAVTGAITGLSSQLADCCCENRLATANLNAAIASDTCAVTTAISNAARDITDNQNANYRALHDEIVQNRMEDKNAQIQQLQSQVQALNLAQSQANQNAYLIGQLRPTPVPSYTVANPYAGFGYGCCGQQACCCQ